ncbi:MAG: stage II sporulation protein P [Clostridia bacterium]|nr:stage II sporulation protein P [Clostridia bacterium]
MHRKKRGAKRPILLPVFGLWAVLCFAAGVMLARGQAAVPTAAVIEVSPEPTIAPTAVPSLTAAYAGYATGLRLRGAEPKILIYHTHTTEAYFPTVDAPYRKTSAWRTADTTQSVVAVGERLKEILETEYGFSVLHDTTDHEPPKLSSAYERSEQTMRAYAAAYPSIELFIDLHRDACGSDPTEPTDFVTVNGQAVARLMFVVGRGDEYADKPFYETSRRFAERVTAYLNGIDPKLARPIREKAGRYNQHVGAYCLLVEVGHNGNTLAQAMAALPYLAEGIAYAAAETEHTVSGWAPEGA